MRKPIALALGFVLLAGSACSEELGSQQQGVVTPTTVVAPTTTIITAEDSDEAILGNALNALVSPESIVEFRTETDYSGARNEGTLSDTTIIDPQEKTVWVKREIPDGQVASVFSGLEFDLTIMGRCAWERTSLIGRV